MPHTLTTLIFLGEFLCGKKMEWCWGWGAACLIILVFQVCIWARGSAPRYVSPSFKAQQSLISVQTKYPPENKGRRRQGIWFAEKGLRPARVKIRVLKDFVCNSSLWFSSRDSLQTYHLGQAQFHDSKWNASDHLVPGNARGHWVPTVLWETAFCLGETKPTWNDEQSQVPHPYHDFKHGRAIQVLLSKWRAMVKAQWPFGSGDHR